jgi:hypothetical protein
MRSGALRTGEFGTRLGTRLTTTLLASSAKHPWATTGVSILGGFGVTSAGLYARTKAQLTSLLSTLRHELDKQKVREAADLCPRQCEVRAPWFGALWGWLRRPHP